MTDLPRETIKEACDRSYKLGREVGECMGSLGQQACGSPKLGQANNPGLTFNPDVEAYNLQIDKLRSIISQARAAMNRAEENMIEAVAAFQAREKAITKVAVEGWYMLMQRLGYNDAAYMQIHKVPQEIIDLVLSELKGFQEKHGAWR